MKKCKKIISIFILMIILLSGIQNIVLGATKISLANLKRGKDIKTNVQYNDGTQSFEIQAKYIYYTENGKDYPAYCISHGLDGVDERGGYTVDIDEFLRDAKNVKYKERIWRVIANGYPYKKIEGLSDYEAYFATKQAIYCVIIPRSTSVYKGLNEQGKKIVNAIKSLTAIGMDESLNPKEANLKINKSGYFVEDGEYYSQTYIVSSSANIGSFKIENINGFPEGSFTSDINGNKKTFFEAGETTFKVMVPKEKLDKDINGTVAITAKCETYPILVGKTRIANTQNYAITCDKYEEFRSAVSLNVNTNTGKVQVRKVDSETSKPLEGIEFELLKDGEKVAKGKTDKEGIWEFEGLYQGKYTLKETMAGEGYIINSENFNINIEYNKKAEITVENEPKKGQVKVIKIDSKNREIRIPNVKFEVLDEAENVLEIITTDTNGEAITSKYAIKDYKKIKLHEIETDKNYKLEEKVLTVNLKENELTEVIIENTKKDKPKLPKTGF